MNGYEADQIDQADEEILTYTATDEALEAAAGTENGVLMSRDPTAYAGNPGACC